MLSVNGIYENGKVTLLEKIPKDKPVKVIVTVLEDSPVSDRISSETSWLGCMAGTGKIVGDIVGPASEFSDWEALQ